MEAELRAASKREREAKAALQVALQAAEARGTEGREREAKDRGEGREEKKETRRSSSLDAKDKSGDKSGAKSEAKVRARPARPTCPALPRFRQERRTLTYKCTSGRGARSEACRNGVAASHQGALAIGFKVETHVHRSADLVSLNIF